MAKIRVLIVDDSAYSRQTIREMLETDPGIEVVGVSSEGMDAMTKTLKLKPDLITLDLEMPRMSGFTFLRWLVKKRPTPVIVVSSYSDSKTVFKALEIGAADFVAKPSKIASIEFQDMKTDLLRKVTGVKDLRMDKLSKNLELFEEDDKQKFLEKPEQEIEAVVIGASTGGPTAIKILITRLPSYFPAGIAISQHMPKGFTASFAERLNAASKLYVKEATDGEAVEKGKVLICPAGFHMHFKKRGQRVVVRIKESKNTDKYIPSVDMMMSSAAEVFGPKTLGVILTGMGNDGMAGMLEIKNIGGYTIAESEATAIVFGMPSAAIRTGAVERVLPISEIPVEIIRLVREAELLED
jgi:two-component system chemotaxis response regulator CheB